MKEDSDGEVKLCEDASSEPGPIDWRGEACDACRTETSAWRWAMAAPFVIEPSEAVDNGIAQLSMLLEPGRAEGFAIFVNNFPGLGGGPPAHHHNTYDEAFYVLSGEMEFCVDGHTARVPPGSMAWAPRGATHAFRNPSAAPASMLVVTTPDAIDLIVCAPQGAENPDVMRAWFAKHDSQVDGPPLG